MKAKTILLVEDDFLNRRLSKKILEEKSYRILEATNSNEALEILKKHMVDLAIIDINLNEKEKDGIQLAQEIKEKYLIPFIYLTAYDSGDILKKAIETFPYSYLTKPFKSIDLIASVELAISQAKALPKKKPSIWVKEEDYKVELLLEEINYVESVGNYLFFHTDKNAYKSRSTLKQLVELLPGNSFVQVHRAFVVNKLKIEKFTPKSIFVNSTEIPISKNFFSPKNALI